MKNRKFFQIGIKIITALMLMALVVACSAPAEPSDPEPVAGQNLPPVNDLDQTDPPQIEPAVEEPAEDGAVSADPNTTEPVDLEDTAAGGEGTEGREPMMEEMPNLDGTSWQLIAYGNTVADPAPALTHAPANITFKSGTVSGSAGCNLFEGTFTTGRDGISIAATLTTRRACNQAEVAQETALIEALATVSQAQMEGDNLLLGYEGGQLQLRPLTAPTTALDSVRWQLIGFTQGNMMVSVLTGREIFAEFTADGTISGNAGCNIFSGSYESDGTGITINTMTMTEMACEESVAAQEAKFMNLLGAAATLHIDGNSLTITPTDGEVLLFQAVP